MQNKKCDPPQPQSITIHISLSREGFNNLLYLLGFNIPVNFCITVNRRG